MKVNIDPIDFWSVRTVQRIRGCCAEFGLGTVRLNQSESTLDISLTQIHTPNLKRLPSVVLERFQWYKNQLFEALE